MKTEAAVLVETGEPLILSELDIPPLKSGQVLVDIAFSGVCHTQILECRGYRGKDKYLPHCLGHEGSGIVHEVGPDVSKVGPGDKVILSWIKGSGADVPSTIYKWNGRDVNSGAITTFSKQSVISENRLTAIPENCKVSMQEAALLGCAVPTGFGSVINVARPKKGQSIAVFGQGGVGLCAVAGAKIMGCAPIIAIDIKEEKLKLAKKFGATHCINASELNPLEEISKICPNGLDFAIESSGVIRVMLQSIHSVRNQGGTAVIVGNAPSGEMLSLDPKQFNLGKRILGTWGGDNYPDRDFLHYIELIVSAKLNLKPLISKIYGLKEINKAIEDLEKGKVIRPLIDMSL